MSATIGSSWLATADLAPQVWSVSLGDALDGTARSIDLPSTGQGGAVPRPFARFEATALAGGPSITSTDFRAPRIAVKSHFFTTAAYTNREKPAEEQPPASPQIQTPARSRRYTRVAPPEDVVGLTDRLSMLLEPPLELLLDGSSLEFPAEPFPFQLQGVAFLYPRQAALLADEMGLGKTMQAITAVRLLMHTREARRVLLVCPKPLVTNWQREFGRWAPELPLLTVEGDRARRTWQWRQADAPLVIANYEILRRDADVVTDPALHFDLMVLDESQRIKNRSGSTSQVVRAISRSRSWALTGTPVENSPEDLVGIFDFLRPGHLNPGMKPRRMGRLAGDYILRRTKSEVLKDMPPKMFRDADVPLSTEQRETYRLAEEEGVLRLTEMGEAATIQHVFELVLRLKQICNFDPATGESAKLERLVVDLEEVAASGQKALVFSQWVDTLTNLKKRLARFKPLEYHGSIPAHRRDDILTEFRNDPRRNVLLMSYGAGGVGLNLQFASYVFLFDRWWNPAVEDQAINRAHRIGAAGPVTVTRFLTPGTIEERIERILRDKREVFDAIFTDAVMPRLGLSQEDIFGLFRLKRPAAAGEVAVGEVVAVAS
ncbi:MAG TPA: DEAD/DEAH box helicase [Pirellulales bacterium]|jgi:SNF2 family DNA or RNA helicase